MPDVVERPGGPGGLASPGRTGDGRGPQRRSRVVCPGHTTLRPRSTRWQRGGGRGRPRPSPWCHPDPALDLPFSSPGDVRGGRARGRARASGGHRCRAQAGGAAPPVRGSKERRVDGCPTVSPGRPAGDPSRGRGGATPGQGAYGPSSPPTGPWRPGTPGDRPRSLRARRGRDGPDPGVHNRRASHSGSGGGRVVRGGVGAEVGGASGRRGGDGGGEAADASPRLGPYSLRSEIRALGEQPRSGLGAPLLSSRWFPTPLPPCPPPQPPIGWIPVCPPCPPWPPPRGSAACD